MDTPIRVFGENHGCRLASVEVLREIAKGIHLLPLRRHHVRKFGLVDLTQLGFKLGPGLEICLLYTSDAADEEDSVDLGGRRIIKKKKRIRRVILRVRYK
eukprot:TRINITY_DN31359_c0_g1_i1.p1 TRINITY_DN31359_c0_g1~~TRINITY_DN31359_c0_g1_i1.p1  ORF type:complete len:100 (+),score=4.56 TRINITY_DN31359_c0_g1_i1:316-615(+)